MRTLDTHIQTGSTPSSSNKTRREFRFTQREEFRGVLVPLLWKQLDTRTRAGFEAMNEALKARAEARAQEVAVPPPAS